MARRVVQVARPQRTEAPAGGGEGGGQDAASVGPGEMPGSGQNQILDHARSVSPGDDTPMSTR